MSQWLERPEVGAGGRRVRRAADRGVRMDATTMLTNDHKAVETLFTRLLDTRTSDVHERRLIFRAIKSELEAHSRVEE